MYGAIALRGESLENKYNVFKLAWQNKVKGR